MNDEPTTAPAAGGISRRQVIKSGAAGALALSGAGLAGRLAQAAGAATSGGKPAHGGTLTVGMITGGTAETMNPGISIAAADTVRCANLYDLLFYNAPDIKTLIPALALSAEHNGDASVWTFHLRDGVHWHDGKPFSADDVVWNFKTWGSTANFNHYLFASSVDFKRVRKRGRLVVEVPLIRPVAEFPSVFAFFAPFIIQNGATNASLRKHPIGTGPFMYQSFIPGTQSVMTRNPHYWANNGKPYVDKLVINSTFTDENSRLNALLGGQIQVSIGIPPTVAATQKHSTQLKILNSPSPDPECVLMRVDKGQFADVRVRQALKLIANREALAKQALDGYATPANDLIGVGCNHYLNLPAPKQDIEKAKSLLKAAGQSHLSFTLPTSAAFAGFVEGATIFAQQAAAAGVKVTVNQVPPSTYYTSAAGFLTRPICIDNGTTYTSLTTLYQTWYTKYAPFNETWWGHQKGGAAAENLINQAIAATNPSKAQNLWHEVQMQQYNQGGTLAFVNTNYLDATAPNIHGLVTTPVRNLNGYRLQDAWIA
jgi:peptide/nickel transport system substrate-binding protein